MKQILLLTDFSNNALNAIHYAVQFFASETCNFHLMHVHKIGTFTSDELMRDPKESIYKSITHEPQKKLNTIIKDLKETFKNPNHKFELHIDFDVFIDAIKQFSKNKNIDYIVMGTNGATNAKEVIFGSNTVNVIRNVNYKTLIIPADYTFKPIKELLLILDDNDFIKGTPFTELLEIIETYQLHLNVLRISPNNQTNKNIQYDKSNLSIIDYKYDIINNVPINFAVASYLQTNTIDSIALFIQKETFFERIFTRSDTKINISKISKPIFTLHN